MHALCIPSICDPIAGHANMPKGFSIIAEFMALRTDTLVYGPDF